MSKPKSHEISKHMVWNAYLKVKANKGAAGVDGESIEHFERNQKGTCTSCGIGCPRGAIFRSRCGWLKYRSRAGEEPGFWEYPLWQTGLPRRS